MISQYASKGSVVAVCTSERRREKKRPVAEAELVQNHGVRGDVHAGKGKRQVSLLAEESIAKMRQQGLDVGPGDFAENITTRGIVLHLLPVGTRLQVGSALLEVSQVGKVCHERCAIFQQAGDCVMPREGIFAVVVRGGRVTSGDQVVVLQSNGQGAARTR